jgi:hypothetical protein
MFFNWLYHNPIDEYLPRVEVKEGGLCQEFSGIVKENLLP